MKGFFILVAVGICMSLVGCASSGVMVNPDRVKQFKEGQTTQAEAVAVLGKPVFVDVEGAAAQQILDYIQSGLSGIGVWPPALVKRG